MPASVKYIKAQCAKCAKSTKIVLISSSPSLKLLWSSISCSYKNLEQIIYNEISYFIALKNWRWEKQEWVTWSDSLPILLCGCVLTPCPVHILTLAVFATWELEHATRRKCERLFHVLKMSRRSARKAYTILSTASERQVGAKRIPSCIMFGSSRAPKSRDRRGKRSTDLN